MDIKIIDAEWKKLDIKTKYSHVSIYLTFIEKTKLETESQSLVAQDLGWQWD